MFRSTLLAALVSLAFAGQTQIEGKLKVTDESVISAILKAHNDERASFGIPPLEWDAKLAQLAAHQSALGCATYGAGHDDAFIKANGGFGQNIAGAGSTGALGPAADLATSGIAGWISEKSRGSGDFTGCAFLKSEQTTCGHFTQVIWKTSTKVGCALDANCKDGAWNNWSFACNYLAPGNMIFNGVKQSPLTATPVPGGSGGGASAPSAPSGPVDCNNLQTSFTSNADAQAYIAKAQAACPGISFGMGGGAAPAPSAPSGPVDCNNLQSSFTSQADANAYIAKAEAACPGLSMSMA